MRGGQQRQPRGLQKANRQLLLASELTYEEDVAERLAGLAHQVGELASTDATESEAIETIGVQLQDLRSETHSDVHDAIVRAQELLLPYSQTV
ncbi:hypothetical protein ACFR9U_01115 [Halorientalis brevis]|uniref:Uncharacterized protein n=1 Tax=Halorientalis brevis TaxID=1126241 RepID=A0ABD6C829_9EURY|nr:hypothetical protein [Halorientalis brevis]